MIKLSELREHYLNGEINKKLYWQIARENYTFVLPQIREVLCDNPEVDEILIRKDGVIITKKSGVRIYLDFSQSISRGEADLILEGDPEKEDIDYIINYLKNIKSSNSVLDIGANAGVFSLELICSNDYSKFILFEPIPNTFEWLKRNAYLNNVDDERFMPFNIGLSDKKGQFEFFVPASNEAASLVENDDAFYRKKANELGNYTGDNSIDKVVCEVDTVDNVVKSKNINNISFIKIDVEGNEKFVLLGAKETLISEKPLVYCELLRKHSSRFGYHPNEVIDYMDNLGYSCFTLKDGYRKLVSSINDDTLETNFFFEVLD